MAIAAAVARRVVAAPLAIRPPLLRACAGAASQVPSWSLLQTREASNKAGVRKSVKKERARRTWVSIRGALKFAERYDPTRTAEMSVQRMLRKLGWPFNENEAIAEGLTVRFTLVHKYVAFEILSPDKYLPGTDLLTPEAQARVDLITGAGWKCIKIRQSTWLRLATMDHGATFASRDFLIKLIVAQAPFDARTPPPVAIGMDAVRARKGTIHSKKRMSGKNP